MAKTTKKEAKTTGNKLYAIYGARMAASGKRINITLCTSDDEGNKEWATITIKDCSICKEANVKDKARAFFSEKDNAVMLSIPMLRAKETTDEKDGDFIPF